MTRARALYSPCLCARTAHTAHTAQSRRSVRVNSGLEPRTDRAHRAYEPRTPASGHPGCARFPDALCAVLWRFPHSLSLRLCDLTCGSAGRVRGVRAVRGSVPTRTLRTATEEDL